MSWEESSTKCKNYYGVVEEPKDERIIPIKIDRGISIHTASDEEEEPFWVVESVKKHEEVRNEIKKIKENKISSESLADSNYDDEDNSLTELLKRVQKQRNDLEDILEKENHSSDMFKANHAEQILSRSNSILSEASTLKASSVSRLSSIEEKISVDSSNESISNISNTQIKNKKEYSSITENITNEFMFNTIHNLDRPKKGSITDLSINADTLENDFSFKIENRNRKYSKHEDSVFNTVQIPSISKLSSEIEYDNSFFSEKSTIEYSEKPKRGSLSRLPSIEERINSSIPTKIISNEYSDRPKRGSLSRMSSTEDSNQNLTLTKSNDEYCDQPKRRSISRLLSSEVEGDNSFLSKKSTIEYSENPKRGSLSRLSSIEERNHSSMPTKIISNEYSNRPRKGSLSRMSSTEDLTLAKSIPSTRADESCNPIQSSNDYSNKSNFTKNNDILENINDAKKNILEDNVNKSSALQMSKADEADNRRKSLIQQSSILSNALSAMCTDIPEISKQKRLSINEDKIDDKYNNSTLKERIENVFSKPSNSIKSVSFDEGEAKDSLDRKSSISRITQDKKSILNVENFENKLNDQKMLSEINSELNDNISIIKKPELLNTETTSPFLNLDTNQTKLNDLENSDLTNKQPASGLLKKILDSTINISNDLIFTPVPNDVNTCRLLNKEIQNNHELPSKSNFLPKDNNLDLLESISTNDMNNLKRPESELFSNNSPDSSLLLKEEKYMDNQEISFENHFAHKKDDINNTKPNTQETNVKILQQQSTDSTDYENETKLKIKSEDTTNDENDDTSTSGIKNIGGIQNIRCNNNDSVVFFFVRSKIVIIQVIKAI